MNKFIIITSIFSPTEAVVEFAKKKDWKLVVVGDKKTPKNWNHKDVTYLSPEMQEGILDSLPWNSYARKNIGYIYAISNGADIIADTDDDNIPYENWGKNLEFKGSFDSIENNDFINIYSLFTNEHVWPRGFPLQKILEKIKIKIKKKYQRVGIWQHLADEDPDVDAIYRLTNNKFVRFKKRDNIVLEKGALSPFNSQNTIFRKELFPLLYLPSFVSFRFTDILRGLIAQPLLWNEGYLLGFGKATVIQKRNPHNYLKDFESEIPFYLYTEKIMDIAAAAINKKYTLPNNLLQVYKALIKEKIVGKDELKILKLWLKTFTKS